MKCFVRPAFLTRNSRMTKNRGRAIRIAMSCENRCWNRATIRQPSFARRRAIETMVFGRISRDFLRTIGVSRGECSARRCTVRAPSLQLWAIPRRGDPHNELTIYCRAFQNWPSYPYRENALYLVSPFLRPPLYALSVASEGWGGNVSGIGGSRITFDDERKELRRIRTA